MAEAAVAEVVRHIIALQYDFDTGPHGERTDIPNDLLRELTGAEGATAIDNDGRCSSCSTRSPRAATRS